MAVGAFNYDAGRGVSFVRYPQIRSRPCRPVRIPAWRDGAAVLRRQEKTDARCHRFVSSWNRPSRFKSQRGFSGSHTSRVSRNQITAMAHINAGSGKQSGRMRHTRRRFARGVYVLRAYVLNPAHISHRRRGICAGRVANRFSDARAAPSPLHRIALFRELTARWTLS